MSTALALHSAEAAQREAARIRHQAREQMRISRRHRRRARALYERYHEFLKHAEEMGIVVIDEQSPNPVGGSSNVSNNGSS